MSTNGKIRATYISEVRRSGLKRGNTYDAMICKDNPQILIVVDSYGDEYGYPLSEFEIKNG